MAKAFYAAALASFVASFAVDGLLAWFFIGFGWSAVWMGIAFDKHQIESPHDQ